VARAAGRVAAGAHPAVGLVLASAEHAELARLDDDGTIAAATQQRLQRSLDLEAARLSDDQH
jgi:hypothetical protein